MNLPSLSSDLLSIYKIKVKIINNTEDLKKDIFVIYNILKWNYLV